MQASRQTYRAAAEPAVFALGQFRALILNPEGRCSYLSQVSFPTEAEAVRFADDVLRGVRPGFHY